MIRKALLVSSLALAPLAAAGPAAAAQPAPVTCHTAYTHGGSFQANSPKASSGIGWYFGKDTTMFHAVLNGDTGCLQQR